MSKKDIEREVLVKFFSGYFHEDWMCDAANPAEVIASYLRMANVHEVSMLREAIVLYIHQVGDDALEKKLFSELGCYYRPSADGKSPREWLLNIVVLLHAQP